MKSFICSKCGKETTEYLVVYGTDLEMEKRILNKKHYCPEHYGKFMSPIHRTSFKALWALTNWAVLAKSPWWGFEDYVRIYRFTYNGTYRNGTAWAYAITVNSDYQDIKEAHIASAIHDGHIPEKITLEELIDDVRKSNDKDVYHRYFEDFKNMFPNLVEELKLKSKNFE